MENKKANGNGNSMILPYDRAKGSDRCDFSKFIFVASPSGGYQYERIFDVNDLSGFVDEQSNE